MCGIFGIVQHKADAVPDKRQLTESAHLLQHRGPDSSGIYADDGIGLVHTRLSLLDLTPRSNQPFWDQQGRYCLVYNGEIYNFKELRTELEQKGVQFRTTSDTEVILELLISCGVGATLPRLEGMFAFALYDKVTKTLILARDRFGIKPLVIYEDDDRFIFSSEVQAMRPWVEFQPDLFSISAFLHGFHGPTKDYSFFRNIKLLPPGIVLKLRRGGTPEYDRFFALQEFWDATQAEELQCLKPKQIVDWVDKALQKSVKQQLFADAPVGALCSGGVDSSLIMAMAAKYHNNLAIFHANVAGPNSEYEAASALAKHLKLDLKAVEVRDHDILDQLPMVTAHYAHPITHMPHSIPLAMVSQLVRENGVKAVLSGEGSDECFLGYRWLAPNIRHWRRYLKHSVGGLLRPIRRRLHVRNAQTWRNPEIFTPVSNAFVTGLQTRFEVDVELESIRDQLMGANGDKALNGHVKSLELLHYNLRSLLNRNDLMGMAASVESRFPFLDSQLVQLAVNIPYHYKIRFSPTSFDRNHYFYQDKWVIRQTAERYLPKALSHRPKWPFRVDAFQRMQVPSSFFEQASVIDFFGLSSKALQHFNDKAPRDLKLKLMHLDVWIDLFLNHRSQSEIATKLRAHIRW